MTCVCYYTTEIISCVLTIFKPTWQTTFSACVRQPVLENVLSRRASGTDFSWYSKEHVVCPLQLRLVLLTIWAGDRCHKLSQDSSHCGITTCVSEKKRINHTIQLHQRMLFPVLWLQKSTSKYGLLTVTHKWCQVTPSQSYHVINRCCYHMSRTIKKESFCCIYHRWENNSRKVLDSERTKLLQNGNLPTDPNFCIVIYSNTLQCRTICTTVLMIEHVPELLTDNSHTPLSATTW